MQTDMHKVPSLAVCIETDAGINMLTNKEPRVGPDGDCPKPSYVYNTLYIPLNYFMPAVHTPINHTCPDTTTHTLNSTTPQPPPSLAAHICCNVSRCCCCAPTSVPAPQNNVTTSAITGTLKLSTYPFLRHPKTTLYSATSPSLAPLAYPNSAQFLEGKNQNPNPK